MSIEEILIEVKSHHTKYVCVTGGEPLSQKKCFELVKELSKNKFNVSIETSGEVLIEGYSEFAKIIMDIKTPSSGEKANICFDNLKFLTEKDEIKLVIQDRTDYEFAKKILNEYKLDQKHLILFSPVYGKINLKELAEWIIKDHLNVRMQTQLHKVIWGENTLGV
jgi:7-carboxy-7-deazaguanine synthase